MQAFAQQDKDELTPKKLQTHLVLMIVGALALGVVSSYFTAYGFYYNTLNTIDNLKESKIEAQSDIKELRISVGQINDHVSEIQTKLSTNNVYTDNNKEQIGAINERVGNVEKKQDEMLKVLYEIKAKQR